MPRASPAWLRAAAPSARPFEAALSDVVKAEPAVHPAFELVNVEMVDEYTIKCATYRRFKSGAELIPPRPTTTTRSCRLPHARLGLAGRASGALGALRLG